MRTSFSAAWGFAHPPSPGGGWHREGRKPQSPPALFGGEFTPRRLRTARRNYHNKLKQKETAKKKEKSRKNEGSLSQMGSRTLYGHAGYPFMSPSLFRTCTWHFSGMRCLGDDLCRRDSDPKKTTPNRRAKEFATAESSRATISIARPGFPGALFASRMGKTP